MIKKKIMKDIRLRLLILKGSRSVKDFAQLLDLPTSTVYYYMNGRTPSLSFITRVCNKLNVRERNGSSQVMALYSKRRQEMIY